MKSKPMRYITTIVTDCPMWNKLDFGTMIKVTDKEAFTAIENGWAKETSSNFQLKGEGRWVLKLGAQYQLEKEFYNAC